VRLWRSLRFRVVVSAFLWALGLAAGTHFFSFHVVHLHPFEIRISHYTALSVFAVGVMLAGLVQLRWSLAPFTKLRTRLTAVRDGRERRVSGEYPSELHPLVTDLNDLLDHRERLVDRALSKAGDLAHGLKTPLALLNQEAYAAEAGGLYEVAEGIRLQVVQMQRQIDYHLAQARAVVSGATPGLRCSVQTSAEGIVRTVRRLYAAKRLEILVEGAPGHFVRGRQEDIDEMLGNLLDNACKWARSSILVRSEERAGRIVITVDDDGPGIDPAMHRIVLRRGVKADEAAPGSGLGLAIVRDLAESYGGTISLGSSCEGGLRAALSLPASSGDSR
jgi:signal transduction histidine kinase